MNNDNFLIACVFAIVVAVLAMSLLMKATERQSVAITGGGLAFSAILIALKLTGWL
jgi:phosphotransferase system  glucose/maltose/N-acetylglucosamine-specific IIC component